MALLAPLALVAALAQAPEQPPFQLDLPTGYPAGFVAVDGPDGRAWVALRSDERAQFEVRHFLLAAPGARADLVAENLRRERWEPIMRGFGSKIKPWHGEWAGQSAAGHDIQYVFEDQARMLAQRLIVDDEQMTIGTWEGPLDAWADAKLALEGIRLPEAWGVPSKAPQVDEEFGLGSTAEELQPVGHFEVEIDASDASWEQLGVIIRFQPAEGVQRSSAEWLLPDGAELDLAEAKEVRYRLSFVEENLLIARAGIVPGPSCLGALTPGWLAMPADLASEDGRFAAPHVSLTVRCSPHLGVVSDVPVVSNEVAESVRTTRFARRPGGATWPIFAIGFYDFRQIAERAVGLRRSAEASQAERPIRFLDQLSATAQQLYPAADPTWSALTFPGAGDQVLPGVLVFDEANRWLSDPIEANWIDGNRRTGLARKIAYLHFGRQLSGRGHGAVFLDAALSEYIAWRLLETAGYLKEARAMVEFWTEREQSLGELPRPLTLMPREDLAGAKRLMTRGALVWRALEARAGRAKLDQVLNEALKRGGSWTTEDLRNALERVTERSWADWFRSHVYGRVSPF